MYTLYKPQAFKDCVQREASLCLLSYFIRLLEASVLQSGQNKRGKETKGRKKVLEDASRAARCSGRRHFAGEKHSSYGAGSVFTLTVYFREWPVAFVASCIAAH